MPNKDRTGPLGRGAGTGRLKGCCAGSRNNANLAGRGQRRRSSCCCGNGQRAGAGGGGRIVRLNRPDYR